MSNKPTARELHASLKAQRSEAKQRIVSLTAARREADIDLSRAQQWAAQPGMNQDRAIGIVVEKRNDQARIDGELEAAYREVADLKPQIEAAAREMIAEQRPA